MIVLRRTNSRPVQNPLVGPPTCEFPLVYDVISAQQKLDTNLQKNLHQNPTILWQPILKWYHENLKYPGADRLYLTLHRHFFWPNNMKQDVILLCKTCPVSQLLKRRPAKK